MLSDEAVDFLGAAPGRGPELRPPPAQAAAGGRDANGSIGKLLEVGPLYTRSYARGALNGEAQVWLDFIVCGVQDEQGDVSRDCTPPNPGQRAEQPPYYPVPEECWDDPDPCTKED